jgi:D-amino-acid dehydrogenase
VPQAQSVIVLGGGVVGMCTALSLQERGLKVTVADPGELPRQASWGSAGRIAVELGEPLSSYATLRALPGALFVRGGPVALPPAAIGTWLPFALRFLAACAPRRLHEGREALSALLAKALPAWRDRLAGIGRPDLLIEAGHLSVWESPQRLQEEQAFWARHQGAATCSAVDGPELGKLKDLVARPIAGALRFTGTAHIADLPQLHAALRGAFAQRGGQMRAPARLAEASQLADLVVVAAGVGSAGLLRAIGHTVPLIAERGYHIQQGHADWPSNLPPIHFEDRAIVVTRFGTSLRATSFVEFTQRDAAPDARKWARLRQHARALGLPFDADATQWLGSRPTLPDYRPAIGRSTRDPRVYYAFGHQHLGLTLAAISGESLAELIAGQPPAVQLAPFAIERF